MASAEHEIYNKTLLQNKNKYIIKIHILKEKKTILANLWSPKGKNGGVAIRIAAARCQDST